MDLSEILGLVLSCRSVLSLDDLANCSLVCRQWEDVSRKAIWQQVELVSESWEDSRYRLLAGQLSKYGSFVRTLILEDCGADKSRFGELLLTMPNLQAILVGRILLHHHSSALLQCLETLSFPRLRYLRLPHVSSAFNEIDALLQVIGSAHRLQYLELMDSDIDDDILGIIAEICPNLKSLDLSRNEVVTFNKVFNRGQEHEDDQHRWTTLEVSADRVVTPKTPLPITLSIDSMSAEPSEASTSSVHPSWSHTEANNNPYSSQGGGDTVMADTKNSFSTLNIQERQQTSLLPGCQTSLPIPATHGNPVLRQRALHNRRVYPSPNLLRMNTPFMHLEELCLVFCIGITNSEFEVLFRSLQGTGLRLLNLQFTNIEDTGLETLARTFGDTPSSLTTIKLSYCSQITSRGIRSIVERCPQLLELDFLGCDLVSADCFRGPTLWRCTGLQQLEFTLHPKAIVERHLRSRTNSETSQEHSTTAADMDPTQTVSQAHSDQQPTDNESGPSLSEETRERQESAGDGDEDDMQPIELEVVESDYHIMFKQLGRLTELRSLHIYNSPALSSGTSTSHSDQEEPSIPRDVIPSTTEVSQEAFDSLLPMEGSSSRQQGLGLTFGSRYNSEGSFSDSLYAEETDHESTLDTESSQSCLALPQDTTPPQVMQVSKPVPIHPFSMKMGFKSLQRLKNIQTLALYEPSAVSLGRSEVKLIGRIFPELSLLRLCGAVEVPDQALERFRVKRPRVRVQVCPLFE
ncbi:hypothetical protein BGX31_003179 [Mortierella sp. GBA43]|nr:hypothetical protein BGX31_003179 [Mortierella sp. GBA43]